MKVVLRPAARADVVSAADHYRETSEALADELVEELDRLLARLSEFPRSARVVQGYASVRRALLRRFPFAVFYTVERGVLVVLRVVHTSRSTPGSMG